VTDPELDESVLPGETPAAYVERVARAKALAGWKRLELRNLPRAAVLAADTTVALEGRILGKPTDRRDAAQMLEALSERTHEVLTAVVLKYEEHIEKVVSISTVTFKPLSKEEIRLYVATGECDDKAGAYAIQGRAAQFVKELQGSFSGVMGLPLYETAQLLERMGSQRDRRNTR
jgi:septum formation protein